MPLPADRLPSDLRTMAAKVAILERQVRELMAARRLAHAAIDSGALTVKDSAGSVSARLGGDQVIIGGTIETADSGNRIVLTADGFLTVYDDSDNITFQAGGLGVLWSPSFLGADLYIQGGFMTFSYDGQSDAQFYGEQGGGAVQLISGAPTGQSEIKMRMAYGASSGTTGRPTVTFSSYAPDGRADLTATGQINAATVATTGDATVGGNLTVTGQANAASMAATGQVSAATVATTGDATIGGNLAVATTTWQTYTPTVTGAGTATFTTRSGWYFKVGKMVFFSATLVVNAAGSGSSNVTITTPSSMDRSLRQTVPCHSDGMVASGVLGTGSAVAFTTGSGAAFDRIRVPTNTAANTDGNLLGSHLLAGSTLTVQGWYREA